MKDTNALTPERVLETAIDAGGQCDVGLSDQAHAVLSDQSITLIHNFPQDPDVYVGFLQSFGAPFENYSNLGEMHKDEPHPLLNRVRYRAPEIRRTFSAHYIDGPLFLHVARAWTDPRPSMFAMYMVDAGWRHLPSGQNGESLFVRWHDLLLNKRDDEEFQAHLRILKERQVEFGSTNVEEPLSTLPLVYPLSDAADEFDYGVRLKQDLLDVMRARTGEAAVNEKYLAALQSLVEESRRDVNQIRFEMQSGDVVIVDNHRVAHGRAGMVGEAEVDGRRVFNPREIWSATLR